MNSLKTALFITIYSILVKSNKHYIVPSVNSLLSLIGKYHGINVKRRWLFDCLKYLEDQGYITRRARWKNDDAGEIRQLPSMITITLPGLKYLISKRVSGAVVLLNKMIGWLKGGDKRFPKPQEIDTRMSDQQIDENKARLREILAFI